VALTPWRPLGFNDFAKKTVVFSCLTKLFPPRKSFTPLEKCVGHNLKNLSPSQKTHRSSWCPKLVTGLALRSAIHFATQKTMQCHCSKDNRLCIVKWNFEASILNAFSTALHARDSL